MKRFLVALVFTLSALGHAEDMTAVAKKEGWTFHFNTKAPKYSTGLLKKAPGEEFPHLEVELDRDTPIPDEYDLRGKISQIENQGNCGSCWAFSLVASVRDALLLGQHDPGRISQQYLVDCDKRQAGCGGGYFDAADYLVEPKGAPLLSEYPYTAKNGRCKASKPAGSIVSWAYIGASGKVPSTEDVQRAILKYGPASVTVGADSRFMAYESGVYNACSSTSTNHMTNLVGWNNKEGYWIMRNSWGTSWGEDGFMRIKFRGKSGNLCNRIAEQAAFVVVKDPGPPPPPPATFKAENKAATVLGEMKKGHESDVDKARLQVQDAIDKLPQ